jgi:ATP-binding cassette, subfamily B, bacterial
MDSLRHYAKHPLAFIARYVRQQPISHSAILVFILSAVGFSVATQYGVKNLVDVLSKGTPRLSDPWPAFILLSAFIAADNLLWRAAGFLASATFVSVTGTLRRDLFEHLLGHSPDYFAQRQGGVLTSRVTATSNAVFAIETMFIWNVLPPCVATFVSIGLISIVSIKMAIVLACVAIVIMIAMFKIAAAGRPLHHAFAERAAAVDGEAMDVVSNIRLVKIFGSILHELTRFTATLRDEMSARRRSLIYLERLRLLHAGTTIALVLILLSWALVLWKNGAATPGQVILVCTLGITVLHATRDLAVALVDATQHMARLSEAIATLLVPHDLADCEKSRQLLPAGCRINFKNVCFRYSKKTPVFDRFNFQVEAGERVGLIGPSGAGKSTMFSLLQRFNDVDRGEILIDGQNVAAVTQQSLRDAIAVVPQDVSLFHRSIIDNIRYARPDATEDEVWNAVVAAHCDDFINSLPKGVDTIVGDRGVCLSGGQRQRIALARAFLKDAPILLLDEATSSLDHESEEAIQEASARLMNNRTVIAIAHRLTTLRNFDRIVLLRHGRIVRSEKPDMLIGPDGRLKGFVRDTTKFVDPAWDLPGVAV